MKDPIDVYAIGSTVLVDGSVSARVNAIFIREGRVMYEIVWWNDRSRKEETVESWEVQPDGDNTKSQRINPIL